MIYICIGRIAIHLDADVFKQTSVMSGFLSTSSPILNPGAVEKEKQLWRDPLLL